MKDTEYYDKFNDLPIYAFVLNHETSSPSVMRIETYSGSHIEKSEASNIVSEMQLVINRLQDRVETVEDELRQTQTWR